MPKNRKIFVNNSVLFLTSRMEEGLPMVSTHVFNFILWGILSRAKEQYQIKVCHFVFMFNHFHMLVVVENPEHVSDFTGYVKGEISHAINKLLGRHKKTIWCEGYDSPVVLTSEDVEKYIGYIYSNPSKANLVDSIEEYPGVSSWKMFVNEQHQAKHKKISRTTVPTLDSPAISINRQLAIVNWFKNKKIAGEYLEFELEPYAWMKCFAEYQNKTQQEVKAELIERIREQEAEYRSKREEKGHRVIGATALRRQSMYKEHTPSTHAPRMICLCHDPELRKAFIANYRALCALAKKVYQSWKLGQLHHRIPPGLLAPRVPALASALTF